MSWPVDKSYEESSNVVNAKKLTGALMLIVGELDTNVDPSSTLQVVNALNQAGKDYDLFFVPGAGHGAGGGVYGTRRQRDFWVRNLLGVQPPPRNGAVIRFQDQEALNSIEENEYIRVGEEAYKSEEEGSRPMIASNSTLERR
jgi:hypothetical protein